MPTDYDPADSAPYSSKKGTSTVLRRDLERLAAFQGRLFAQKTYAVLVILQGMDAAGKDSVVKHVMSGINPQGCQVWSFKEPSGEDLEHDYLWRVERAVPPRGMIGIFNRSYYEEVLVVRVHPQLLARQRLPQALMNKNIWRRRFDEINAFEQYLTANGIVILKFFLNISKDEQKQRFLERIERPEKNWKFSLSDVHERAHWDAYMRAYEDMLIHTSTIGSVVCHTRGPQMVYPAGHSSCHRGETRRTGSEVSVSEQAAAAGAGRGRETARSGRIVLVAPRVTIVAFSGTRPKGEPSPSPESAHQILHGLATAYDNQ